MERIREAAAVLSHPKPRYKDVRPLQSKWQVVQTKDKTPRRLPEVLDEFQGKVIKAANGLQLKLLGVDDDPFLAELERAKKANFVELGRVKEADLIEIEHANTEPTSTSPPTRHGTARKMVDRGKGGAL